MKKLQKTNPVYLIFSFNTESTKFSLKKNSEQNNHQKKLQIETIERMKRVNIVLIVLNV